MGEVAEWLIGEVSEWGTTQTVMWWKAGSGVPSKLTVVRGAGKGPNCSFPWYSCVSPSTP